MSRNNEILFFLRTTVRDSRYPLKKIAVQIYGRLFLCQFPSVRKQVPVSFYRGVWWPCGTFIDNLTEVIKDINPTSMAGNG